MQPLPSVIHLRQLKNQSKDLRDACRTGQTGALARLYEHHPQHSPTSNREISLQDAQLVIAREQGFDSWPKLVAAAEQSRGVSDLFADFVGVSSIATRIRQLLARAASSDLPVLLIGEPGTGKRWSARLIHEASDRSSNAPQRLTCSGNGTLIESELFGHELDAFTGARSAHAGLLQSAQGGSILMDDVEQLELDTQFKLQSYLDTGRFRRLGGESDLISDARLIVSTTSTTLALLKESLREDLFYQLSVLVIDLPPLRNREEDVESLTRHFASQVVAEHATDRQVPDFSAEALRVLRGHTWPGNVRELRNVVERAVMTTEGPSIGVEQLQLLTQTHLV